MENLTSKNKSLENLDPQVREGLKFFRENGSLMVGAFQNKFNLNLADAEKLIEKVERIIDGESDGLDSKVRDGLKFFRENGTLSVGAFQNKFNLNLADAEKLIEKVEKAYDKELKENVSLKNKSVEKIKDGEEVLVNKKNEIGNKDKEKIQKKDKNYEDIGKGKNYDDVKNKIGDYTEQLAKEKVKQQYLEKAKQKATIVNTDEIAEAEARKAADAYMTESAEKLAAKKSTKTTKIGRFTETIKYQFGTKEGLMNMVKRVWKHTFFDEYYRQRQIARTREEIKNTGNIYTGRLTDKNKIAHEIAMKGISDRFSSEYEDSLVLSEKEERKTIDNSDPEVKQANSDLRDLINDYASGKINEDAFKASKDRIIKTLKNKDLLGSMDTYADNIFEIAKNARKAIEHGAKLNELELDTNMIIGKAKSSLKTEAHFNKVDKIVDKMKKSQVRRFISPAVLNTSIGLFYSISVGVGAKLLRSKAAAWGTFGLAVGVSSLLAGANESQRLALERAQHDIEMAEGSTYEAGSKKREHLDKFAYQTESSSELAQNLRNLMFNKDAEGKDVLKDIKPEDMDKILASLADIEARNSLNATNRIDLISYSNIRNVEKERTDLTILTARAKVELRKKITNDFQDGKIKGKTFDEYLKEQTETIENSLLGGDAGITAQDKAFSKFKTKEVAKKMLTTAIVGLTIGATVQEGIAFFKDDIHGVTEGMFNLHSDAGPTIQTPLEQLRSWITGDSTHVPMGNPLLINLDGHELAFAEGTTIVENGDGTINILRGGNVISENFTPTYDSSGALDEDALARLGKDGIIATTTCNVIEGTKEVVNSATEYIDNNNESTHQIVRDRWWGNDTEMLGKNPDGSWKTEINPETGEVWSGADHNEIKGRWGGLNGTGIDENRNYVLNHSRMTPDGSFQDGLSTDITEKIKDGGKVFVACSLTGDTQGNVFYIPVNPDGNMVVDPDSEIGKLFFAQENGHAVFKGRFAELVEVLETKDGKDYVAVIGTLEGPGNDSITDVVSTTVEVPTTNLAPSLDTQPPMFIPIMSRKPLERLKAEVIPMIYDESYLDRDLIYEDPTYLEEPIDVIYEDESYLDQKNYLDKDVIEKKEERLSKESIEKYISETKNYIDKNVDVKIMEELNSQIKESMDNNAKMSVVLPCYKEGENIYKTLSDWTIKQKDLKPEELEIITFVNAPDKDQKLDTKTIFEIERFKKDHPEYKIQLVKHNFDFKSNRKMGTIYKMPTDLAVYRNLKRLENGVSEETVASHLLRSGGADALGRNSRFLREVIDFMENHPNTEQLRTQSAYPPEVREKFPLFNLVTVFNHSLSQLYTYGESNIGLGTYRARAYAEASGFDPSREYREEIDLGARIRSIMGGKKDSIKKLVKKNAIDNPRRELFALANGDTILRAYNNFSKPEKDQELRNFDWNKELPDNYKKNIEMNEKNMTREFDSYFQHFLSKFGRESGIVTQILKGQINAQSINSPRIHPEARALLSDPEGVKIIESISEARKSGKEISNSSEESKQLVEFITKRLFDRILRLSFGFKKGLDEDYKYEKSSDGKLHIIFNKNAVEKVKKMSKRKWDNFKGYWPKK